MKTIEEINRAIHDGETPPLFCVEDFLDHVTRENFDEVFAMLDPKVQRFVRSIAEQNADNFDNIIESVRDRPGRDQAWLAYKEWAERQPWFDEVLSRPMPRTITAKEGRLFLDAEYATELLRIAKDGLACALQDGDAAQVEAWRARVKKLAEDDIPRLTAIYQETKARLEQAHAEAEERRIAAHRASKR